MILLITVLLMTSGTMYVIVKNRQVSVAREIDASQNRIEEVNETMKMVQVKIDRQLNRYIIRSKLVGQGSELQSIPSHAIEVISSSSEALAVTDIKTP